MSSDIDTLTNWLRACLIIAALCTTSFPLLYLFFPWHSTLLGRLLMLQAVAFAIAIDFTLLLQYWHTTNIMLLFWCEAIIFSLIAASTLALTIMMWRTNYKNNKRDLPRRRNTDV